jgi:hypothetical protein
VYFRKLDIDVRRELFSPEQCQGDYSHNYNNGLYKKTSPSPATQFLAYKLLNRVDVLPDIIKAMGPAQATWIRIIGGAKPHVDPGPSCGLNIYVTTGGATTFFHGMSKEYKLIDVASFVAQPFDVYLFDTTKLHSVVPVSGEERTLVKVSWTNKTFSQLSDEFDQLTLKGARDAPLA